MTTSPGEENSGPSRTRKTRPQTACEFCRRRKIGCDGAQRPGKQCSNCAACNVDCKYSDSRRVLAPSKSYIQELEKKLERMENIMRRILPETHVGGLSTAEIEDRLRQEDYERDAMDNSLTQAKLGYIYHGKSSTAQFIQTARVFKQGHTGEISDRVTLRRSEFWDAPPWHQNTWFQSYYPDYTFPEDDLLSSLVDLYFVEVNIFVPLLHRPTFEKLVNDKFYLEDKEFATVLLYVCALSSRYTDDPRVLSDGVSSKQSNGWKWIDQVIRARKSLISVPTLHSLQCICLFAQFMLGSSAPHLCWTIASIGLRSSLEAGLHRRKVNYANPTIESELWKRAFWTLVYIDRQISAFLGRSCCLFDEEIDLDLPIECDDEYWEPPNAANAFRQPLGRPALVSYFNCYLKLTSSITTCLRTIYAIERSLIRRVSLDLDKNWQKRMIEQLNARLKLWMDAMPDHLRWDPDRKDPIHLAQSASLHLQYRHLQMLIYRPFISMPYDSEKFPFHSVTICTNAARVCADIIDTQLRRKGHLVPYYGLAAFNAAAVLLFDYWQTKRGGLPVNPADMKLVDACMKTLQVLETRWQIAGRLWDVLHELVSVGDLHPNSANPEMEMTVDNNSIFTPNEVFPDSLSEILLGGNTFYDGPAVDESSWFSNIELPLVPLDEVNTQPQISVASSENVGLEPSHVPPRGEGYVNGTQTLQKFGFTIDNQDSFLEPSCFFSKSAVMK
ncbi:fungal-specific transcription factor domain-containing protein [Desarmillaria tabescens]|uniref:Fungal-specific transcription factor domain-containing protein n=1 Tax=Armillaria tabescens TaxID=1929756 RepID=A0AA39KAW6_ARMTA|nr:fungal-specific transcription factor domain-containing protein [Desarmillaria tabescens]KAK0457720.1 fungal-specific transcription factor domain-containing protein [Desarmillaria tabescens]